MNDPKSGAATWAGIDPKALADNARSIPPALKVLINDPDPAIAGAAAYRLAALARPSLCALPVAWCRRSPTRCDLMVNDAKGNGWLISLTLETVSTGEGGTRQTWLAEIAGGPFGTDPDADQINPRDMQRRNLSVVGGTQHRMAA